MSVKDVNDANFESEVLQSERPVLVDFYAPWCGPCHMVSPVVEGIASENPDIKVVKVNVDKEQALAAQYQVMSIPTLIVFKDGKITNRSTGVKSKFKIMKMLKDNKSFGFRLFG